MSRLFSTIVRNFCSFFFAYRERICVLKCIHVQIFDRPYPWSLISILLLIRYEVKIRATILTNCKKYNYVSTYMFCNFLFFLMQFKKHCCYFVSNENKPTGLIFTIRTSILPIIMRSACSIDSFIQRFLNDVCVITIVLT